MLKEKSKFSLLIILIANIFLFVWGSNKIKKAQIRMENPRFINISNPNDITTKIAAKDKFILYVGHSLCGDSNDFMNNPLKEILEEQNDLHIYYVDLFKQSSVEESWDEILGPKNDPRISNPTNSPIIRCFTFYYTPTLIFIKDGKAQFVWENFGGGEKRNSRYFRNDIARHQEGFQNSKKDVLEIIEKWKQG